MPLNYSSERIWIIAVGCLLASAAGFLTLNLLPASPEARLRALQEAELKNDLAIAVAQSALAKESAKAIEESIKQIPTKDTGMLSLDRRIGSLDARVESIETAVSSSPEKALSLPPIRKDMENLQERYKSDLAELHDDVSRTYTLVEWMIGLLVTLIISLAGMTATLFRSSKGVG